ncbi:putative immunoglobulin-blocking virulence protein [Mycoplasma sp. 'Moose RK']|uniref:putative immunoglobulin-blocking virulence protein n=1 Tax=Mycoplasma sp. 'Moose RK' TaxID=2780095 RepID=UPI0018C335F0|nr:putative immunoglobulin-blocking virulence protein [Mycoplasma sp. 'Moose RK']MBG0730884.1 putative immunoglobulin-blocking virulence protein [Mycoplasma sp. 'Moose RK']
MVAHLSRRKKMITIALASPVVIFGAYLTSSLINHIYASEQIKYSTIAPSTILKNRPNDTGFRSPVANTDYVSPPPAKKLPEAPKPSPGPKIEVEKPIFVPKVAPIKPIENPIPQEKPNEKPKIVAPIVAPIPVPTPIPPRKIQKPTTITQVAPPTQITRPVAPTFTPPASTPAPTISVNPADGRYAGAIENLKFRASTNVNTAQRNISNIEAQIKDLESQRDQKEKSVYWNSKVSLEAWNETYNYRINNKKYELERQKYDLQYHQQRKQRFEQGRLTKEEIDMINKGYTPDRETDGWEPKVNIVKQGIAKSNESGIAPNKSPWQNQDSTIIGSLKRLGWKGGLDDSSSHLQTENFKKALSDKGISNTNSIKLIKYTKEQGNGATSSYNSFHSLVLDSTDPNALKNFSEILKSLASSDQELKEIVLRNVKGESAETIGQIIGQMPSSIISLRLFVEDPKGLEGLSKLEGHKLSELSLYSNLQKDNGSWAINPNGLKDVDFVKWEYVDKGSIQLYNPAEKLPGSIRFDTLNWASGHDQNKINEGLKIAYGSKINQRVFQGVFGGRGGYPPNLDFSKTNQKTFKGIQFDEANKAFNDQISNWDTDTGVKQTANYFLKFANIYFGYDGDSSSSGSNSQKGYEVNADDFDGQFSKRLNFGPYEFSTIFLKDKTGKQVQNVPLVLKGNTITDAQKNDLSKFIEAAKRSNAFSKIIVESGNTILGSSFGGLTVEKNLKSV